MYELHVERILRKSMNTWKGITNATNYIESVVQGFVANHKGDVYALNNSRVKGSFRWDQSLGEELVKEKNADQKIKAEEISNKSKGVLKSNV